MRRRHEARGLPEGAIRFRVADSGLEPPELCQRQTGTERQPVALDPAVFETTPSQLGNMWEADEGFRHVLAPFHVRQQVRPASNQGRAGYGCEKVGRFAHCARRMELEMR